MELNELIQRSGIGPLPARNSVATSSFEIRLGKNLSSAKNQVIKSWRNALRTKESQAETTQISSFNGARSSLPSVSQRTTLDEPLREKDLTSKGALVEETHPEDCLFKRKPLPNIYCDDPKLEQERTVVEPPAKNNLTVPIPAPRRSKSPKETSDISSGTHVDVVHDFSSDISDEGSHQQQDNAEQDRDEEPSSDTEEDHSSNWDSDTR